MTERRSTAEGGEDPHNVKFWNKIWVEDQVYWQMDCVHPNLLKNIELMTGQKLNSSPLTNKQQLEENSKKTWFIPLCGKTEDIPYLLSQGFRVFGVEAVKMAVDELNAEHNLGMEYNEEEKLFSGLSGRVQIYIGDFFKCPVEKFGPFDYIWDRGSFIAVEYPFRNAYAATMQRALRNADGSWYNFNYLLETLLYDKSTFEGPPRSADDEDMKQYYGSWANFRLLSTCGGADALFRMFHITPKLDE